MSAVPKSRLTPAEYLARERAAEYRSEFFDGEMFALAGASYAHVVIADNLTVALGTALCGGPCRTLSHDMRVKVSPTGLYTYPDIVVLCGPPELEDANGDTLLNPTAIIEVLSDATEKYDRGKKFDHYRRIASLQEYVLVAQDRPQVERFARQPDGGWLLTVFADPAGEFALSSAPARIPMAEVYRGVELPSEEPPPS